MALKQVKKISSSDIEETWKTSKLRGFYDKFF